MDVPSTLAWDVQADPPIAAAPSPTSSPGLAWLRAVAARAALVQQHVANGHCRDDLLTLHAHHAISAPQPTLARVVDDLGLRRCDRAAATEDGLADSVTLFRAAIWLLDILTTEDPVVGT